MDENKELETPSSQPQSEDSSAGMFAFLFYLAAVGLTVFGIVNAFYDSDYKHSIVKGDAYNYIIFAGRGLIFVGAGIVSALLGIGCQILSCMSQLKNKQS